MRDVATSILVSLLCLTVLQFSSQVPNPTRSQESQDAAILSARTSILATSDSNAQTIKFVLEYAQAKVRHLKTSDPAMAQLWRDYFFTRPDDHSVPPGVLAYAKQLVRIAEVASKHPNEIVLSRIYGEDVIEDVFNKYRLSVQETRH